MEHTVNGVKFKLTTNPVEDDFAAVLLQISSKHMEMEVLFSDPCVVSKKKWIKFRNFVDKDGDEPSFTECLNFCLSNGEVSMSCDSEWIRFTVGKMGAGGDGESTTKLSQDEFGDTFVKMLDLIIANEMMNKGWGEMESRK